MIKAILMDMDGVIADSEGAHKAAEKSVIARRGKVLPEKLHRSLTGVTSEYFWATISRELKIADDYRVLRDEKNRAYEEVLFTQGVKFFDDTLEFIRRHHEHYRIAVASSSYRKLVDEVLRQSGVAHLIHATVAGDEVARSKPEPDIYLRAAVLLGVSPHECIGIEDAINGIRALKKAGTKALALTHSFERERLQEADYIFDSLRDVHVKDL